MVDGVAVAHASLALAQDVMPSFSLDLSHPPLSPSLGWFLLMPGRSRPSAHTSDDDLTFADMEESGAQRAGFSCSTMGLATLCT